jgi:hypothetical protein
MSDYGYLLREATSAPHRFEFSIKVDDIKAYLAKVKDKDIRLVGKVDQDGKVVVEILEEPPIPQASQQPTPSSPPPQTSIKEPIPKIDFQPLYYTPGESVSLKVYEAPTRDVGRGIARIDYDTMDSIGVCTGDIVEIKGKRRTVAKCMPQYPIDEGKGIIRMDGLVRNNAATCIPGRGPENKERVIVRKVKAVPADRVIVISLDIGGMPPDVKESYLTDTLESVPVIKGDNILVPYYEGRLAFQVTSITPAAEAVIITQKTVFQIEGILRCKKEEVPGFNANSQIGDLNYKIKDELK